MRRRTAAPWAVLPIVAAAATAGTAPGESTDVETRGHFLYRVYCRSCHGDGGRGDGPAAARLATPPADLTRLTGAGHEFPAERVARVIDGRDESPGHEPRRMPLFGFAFQELDRDVAQEAGVAERVRWLVDYLRSIQSPPSPD